MADLGFFKGGRGSRRRRRRGDGVWGGGAPLPTGEGVWEGGRATSPENFWTFYLEIALFGAFLGVFLKFVFQSLHAIFVTVRATGMTEHG